jgi:hypothetical protein
MLDIFSQPDHQVTAAED